MKSIIEKLGEAYLRYALNPSGDNLSTLEKLTGAKSLLDVLEATEVLVDESSAVKPLRNVQKAIRQLDAEPEIFFLDKRIQAKSHKQFSNANFDVINSHIRKLRRTLRRRIRHLTQSDKLKAKVQMQLFALCCRRFMEMIEKGCADLLGPQSYDIAENKNFLKDARLINQMSKLRHPKKKLEFFCEHVNRLQDKYLPGEVVEDQLCQLLIVALTCADNPQLLWDLQIADRAVTPRQRHSIEGQLMHAASVAVYMIQREALPDVRKQLAATPGLTDLEEDFVEEKAA